MTQFVNYLDEIEAELKPYDDGHRREHLLAKLSLELQYTLNNYQNQPETRTGLIKLAIQLEANLTGRSRLTRGSSNEPQHTPKEKGKGKGRNRNFPVRQKEVTTGTYVQCGIEGDGTSTVNRFIPRRKRMVKEGKPVLQMWKTESSGERVSKLTR